jgi:hypothetical protein
MLYGVTGCGKTVATSAAGNDTNTLFVARQQALAAIQANHGWAPPDKHVIFADRLVGGDRSVKAVILERMEQMKADGNPVKKVIWDDGSLTSENHLAQLEEVNNSNLAALTGAKFDAATAAADSAKGQQMWGVLYGALRHLRSVLVNLGVDIISSWHLRSPKPGMQGGPLVASQNQTSALPNEADYVGRFQEGAFDTAWRGGFVFKNQPQGAYIQKDRSASLFMDPCPPNWRVCYQHILQCEVLRAPPAARPAIQAAALARPGERPTSMVWVGYGGDTNRIKSLIPPGASPLWNDAFRDKDKLEDPSKVAELATAKDAALFVEEWLKKNAWVTPTDEQFAAAAREIYYYAHLRKSYTTRARAAL